MNALLATQLLLQLMQQAQAIGEVIARAQREGRDVSSTELEALKQKDDLEKARLDELIEAARR